MGFLLPLCYVVSAVLLFPHSSFHVVNSATLSILTDKEALLAFKSLISIDPSNTLSSWEENSSPCNWTGVFCNEDRQRVIGLDLSGLKMTGTISPHIGNLSFLRSLQLQENQFTGTIPDQVGDLFRLRVLNMSSNRIKGAIPLNMTMCSELEILDLMGNEISGAIPAELGHLSNLEILKLGRNKLSGVIPTSISNLSSLITLDLITNTIGGIIPIDLGRLQNLKYLDLSINNLTGTVPSSLYNVSSLVYFALASNQLWGPIPSDVGDKLPNLLYFNFCINKFTGSVPGSLHNLTNIREIRMAHNRLVGSVPPGLGNLPELRMYNLGFNRIVSSGERGLDFITSLTNSTRLNFLAIDGNLLEGVIPESVGNLSTSLTHLYMGGNLIYGSIPISISHLRNLALLNLSYNSISGGIPSEIGQLEELQELNLAGNQISGTIPISLGNLQKLNLIDLSGNELVGRIPTTFFNFQKLLSLDLSNNRLNETIPKEIFSLSSLSTLLNISKNFLSGPLPQEVGTLQSVVTIDLSDNHLEGSIPESIGDCKSLEELFMANNMLSGSIPSTLEEVKGLETLDLSSNQLSGSIPGSLQKLQVLQLLNLSFNNLEGVVPSEGIFRNLSRVHVQGNSNLCLNVDCEVNRGLGRGRRFTRGYIIIPIIAFTIAICLLIGLFLCFKKNKGKTTPTPESHKVQYQMVSYDELRLATGNFNQENLVGNGSFGSVYRGCLREGIVVAVKVLDMGRNGSWKSFWAECEALRNVRHRNLVKLVTSCSSIDSKGVEFLALVYEFMSNGSLDDWIKGRKRHSTGGLLTVLDRLNVAIDVACAMDYLHHDCETPVVHCDLKPSNVLLHEDMTAKVGDFGLARMLIERAADQHSGTETHSLKGSIGYIPPGAPVYEERPLEPLPEIPSSDEEPAKGQKKRGRPKAVVPSKTGRKKTKKADDIEELFASISQTQKGSGAKSGQISTSSIAKPQDSGDSTPLHEETVEDKDGEADLLLPVNPPTNVPPKSTASEVIIIPDVPIAPKTSGSKMSSTLASLEKLRSMIKSKSASPTPSLSVPSDSSKIEKARKFLKSLSSTSFSSIHSQINPVKAAVNILLADPDCTPGLSVNLNSFLEQLATISTSFNSAHKDSLENKSLLTKLRSLQVKLDDEMKAATKAENLYTTGEGIILKLSEEVEELERQLSAKKEKLEQAKNKQLKIADSLEKHVEAAQKLAELCQSCGDEEELENNQVEIEAVLQRIEDDWIKAKEFIVLDTSTVSSSKAP